MADLTTEQGARPNSVLVFVNPTAGLSGETESGPLVEALAAVGVTAKLQPTSPPQLGAALARVAAEGTPVVVVCGGDGTLCTAANALVGSATTLAPFPTGTLNHFARRLGLEDVATAATALTQGVTLEAPVGIMDDRIFLNTATFGLYSDLVRRREHLRRWLWKWPAAGVAFMQTLLRMRQITITLEAGGKVITHRTPLLWVGIGWGSFPLVHESPDDRSLPDLEVVILRPGGRLGALALLFRIAVLFRSRERLQDDPALEFLHTRRLLIHAHRRIGVTLDGEVMRCESPIFVGVQEGALSVRVPAP